MHLRSAAFKGSGDVFTMSWTRDGIPNDIFKQALSHRLFMPILSAEPTAVFGCACGAVGLNTLTCSMHAGACRIARGHAIERHDRVVDAVAAFVQEIDPQAIITRPAQPQENPNPDVPRNVVEDLTITSRGSIQRFDVGITHAVLSNNTPTAGHIQHYNPDTSCLQYEIEKRNKYRHAQIDVTPLILLSTGKIGPSFRACIEQWTTGVEKSIGTSAIKRLQKRITRCCAIFDGKARMRIAKSIIQL